jgi:hypothetical protein
MTGFKEILKFSETEVRMIKIDGLLRRVYIKFNNSDRAFSVFQETVGLREFRHDIGELSPVRVDCADMGVRRVRVGDLPHELHNCTIRGTLGPYGEVTEIHEDFCCKAYRYPVYNGVRIAATKLKKTLTIEYDDSRYKGTYNV